MTTTSYNKKKPIPTNQLTKLRDKHAMSKSYLADLLGVTLAVVSHHENRARGIGHFNILRYCEIFRCYAYELFDTDENRVSNRLQLLRTRNRLTATEVAKLTGIPEKEVLSHEMPEVTGKFPKHGQIIMYARLYKCFTHEIFIDAELTPDEWPDMDENPVDIEEQFADPVLYNEDGRLQLDDYIPKGNSGKYGEAERGRKRWKKGTIHDDMAGRRKRRIPLDDR